MKTNTDWHNLLRTLTDRYKLIQTNKGRYKLRHLITQNNTDCYKIIRMTQTDTNCSRRKQTEKDRYKLVKADINGNILVQNNTD